MEKQIKKESQGEQYSKEKLLYREEKNNGQNQRAYVGEKERRKETKNKRECTVKLKKKEHKILKQKRKKRTEEKSPQRNKYHGASHQTKKKKSF